MTITYNTKPDHRYTLRHVFTGEILMCGWHNEVMRYLYKRGGDYVTVTDETGRDAREDFPYIKFQQLCRV